MTSNYKGDHTSPAETHSSPEVNTVGHVSPELSPTLTPVTHALRERMRAELQRHITPEPALESAVEVLLIGIGWLELEVGALRGGFSND